MKNLGQITDPKDIITKEYLDEGIGVKVNTLEDNLQMAESDIETLQSDVQGLQTDNTATKAAVKTLQDTYVPNTRKVNGKALDADITIDTAFYVNATISEADQTVVTLDKTNQEISNAYNNGLPVFCIIVYGSQVIAIPLVSTNIAFGLEFVSTYVTASFDGDLETRQIIIYEGVSGWNIRYKKAISKTSQLTNDSGFLTSAPVQSVNNKTGAVTLTASDIGALALVGGTMEGNISMGSNKVTGVGTPTDDTDATTKEYVDGLIPSVTSLTMSANSWNTSAKTYSFEATYPFANYNIAIELAGTATDAQITAWGEAKILGSATANVATAKGTVPTVDIPIILTVTPKKYIG